MAPVATYAYEDFSVGREFPLGPQSISAAQIIEFASEFDPQPMHLSEEAGRQSILGGLAASGWHTCALLMRMMAESYISDSDIAGQPRHRLCRLEKAGSGWRYAFGKIHCSGTAHLQLTPRHRPREVSP